jgi:hypothetical protein
LTNGTTTEPPAASPLSTGSASREAGGEGDGHPLDRCRCTPATAVPLPSTSCCCCLRPIPRCAVPHPFVYCPCSRDSQGFCCDCDGWFNWGGSDGRQSRGGLNCGWFNFEYSAHCLRLNSSLWYQVREGAGGG